MTNQNNIETFIRAHEVFERRMAQLTEAYAALERNFSEYKRRVHENNKETKL